MYFNTSIGQADKQAVVGPWTGGRGGHMLHVEFKIWLCPMSLKLNKKNFMSLFDFKEFPCCMSPPPVVSPRPHVACQI